MGFGRGFAFFVRPARWGLFASHRLRDGLARVVSLVERVSSGGEAAAGAVRVDVWGELHGREVHHVACGIGKMREATGLSLSIGTQMLARKELLTQGGGVFAPEAGLDPLTFISRLSTAGIQAYSDLTMSRPIA